MRAAAMGAEPHGAQVHAGSILAALDIVFVDIGTSALHALAEATLPSNVLGAL